MVTAERELNGENIFRTSTPMLASIVFTEVTWLPYFTSMKSGQISWRLEFEFILVPLVGSNVIH